MITDAVAAAAREDWAACLGALLAAWRPKREPELATLIDRVAARTSAPVVEARAPVIAARIRAATDVDIGPIVETILRQARTVPDLVRQAIELATMHAPDPRVATLIANFFGKSRYARADGALEPGIADALDGIDDPRYRELLTRACARLLPRRGRLISKRPRIDRLVAIAAKINGRRPIAPASAALLAAIAAIDASLATITAPAHDHATLLAAIYADPESSAARLIYADALQEAGDPRGEFIALQCAGGPVTKRERQLLELNARAWLGPIDPHLQKQGLVYRRGFVAAAIWNGGTRSATTFAPEWQTLEHLDSEDGWGAPFVELRMRMHALRRVDRFYGPDLPLQVALGPVPWTHLGLRTETCELHQHRATFPALEVLRLGTLTHGLLEPGTELELGSWLKLVGFRVADFTQITRIRETAARLGSGGCELELEFARKFQFEPLSTSNTVRIAGSHATFDIRTPEELGNLRDFIQSLPPAWIRSITTNHALGDELTAALDSRGIAITLVPPPDRSRQ